MLFIRFLSCANLVKAHWYYEDYLADHFSYLPHYAKLEPFCREMFARCDILKPMQNQFQEQYDAFKAYRATIPVFGGILLNQDMSKVLLVQGWKGKSWSFPKGKVNEAEDEVVCAAREVYEEIGYDMTPLVNPNAFVETNSKQGKRIKLFIVRGVDENFEFAPQVQKEIGDIKWFSIEDLPVHSSQSSNMFWSLHTFTPQLCRWMRGQQGGSRPHSRPRSENNSSRGKSDRPNSRNSNLSPNSRADSREQRRPASKISQSIKSNKKSKLLFQLDLDQIMNSMDPFLALRF